MAKKSKKLVAEAMGVEKYRPHIELDEKLYPKLKELNIDDVVELNIKVKVKSITRQEWNGNKLCVTAEVQDAEEE